MTIGQLIPSLTIFARPMRTCFQLGTAFDSLGAADSGIAGVSGTGVTVTLSGDGVVVTVAMRWGILEKVSMCPLISDFHYIGHVDGFTRGVSLF